MNHPELPVRIKSVLRLIRNTLFNRYGLVLLGVALIFVLLDVGVSNTAGDAPITGSEGDPDQFALYQRLVRTGDGADQPAYRPNYLLEELQKARVAAKRSGVPIPWVEHGPSNVSGRTRAVVVDSDDPTGRTWFAASVSGGVWKTSSAGSSWIHLTEDLPNLSFSTIVQAPTNPDVFFAGTGEGFANLDAVAGSGVFRSTDHGNSWKQLASTTGNSDFRFVNRLIISPVDANTVLAATREGIMRSTDGGISWSRVYAAVSGIGSLQIVAHPDDFDRIYATDGGVGVIRSLDGGLSWQPASLGLSGLEGTVIEGVISTFPRVELAIAPTDPFRIYAAMEGSESSERIFMTFDGADHWVELEMNADLPPPDFAREQGWYDLAVAVHPENRDIFFVGGLDIYRVTLTGSAPGGTLSGLDEIATESFMALVRFPTATHFDQRMRTGLSEANSGITAADFATVEVRFGPGRTQKAHRFTPPDGPGIPFADYPYADYTDVPFEVWDITNNRQLMVSFRDRLNDGFFDLIPRDESNLGREYLLIHARTYNASQPDPEIAVNGGVEHGLLYFFWPMGANGSVWDPSTTPSSTLRINFEAIDVPYRQMQKISSGNSVHVDQHALVFFTDENSSALNLIATNDGGVFYSKNGGVTWLAQGTGYNTAQFFGVDKAPDQDRYFGGTQDNGSWVSGIAPSKTSAWEHRITGDGFEVAWNQEDDRFLLGAYQFNEFRRSTNGGASFQTATSGLTDVGSESGGQFVTTLARSIDDPFTVFTMGKSGVWKSVDFGASWALRPIPAEDWGFWSAGKVRVSLADSRFVWAGYEMDPTPDEPGDDTGKLHRSSDGGETFIAVPTPVSLAPGRISGLATHPLEPETAYVLFSVAGRPKILRTQDLGGSWEDLSGFADSPGQSLNGFPDVAVYDLLVIPGRPGEIWVGTEIGLFVSFDNGLSWSYADNGLPAVSIWRMKIVDDRIIIATHGRGVWSVDIESSGTVGTIADPSAPAEEFVLGQNFPNPLSLLTTIPFQLPRPQRVTLIVYDLLGREIDRVVDEHRAAGPHTIEFDASSLASGTYLYRLTAGSMSKSRTMTITR